MMGDLWTLANVVAALAVIAFFTGLVWKVANWVRDIRTNERAVASNREDLRETNERLYTMVSEVTEIKVDVSYLKTDVSELKVDVSNLKTDVAEVKSDLAAFKKEVRDNFAIVAENFKAVGENFKAVAEEFKAVGKEFKAVRQDIKDLAMAVKGSAMPSEHGNSGQGDAGAGDVLPDMDLAVEAQSPLGLSQHGVKIAERINAAHIAKKYAHRVELPANASHYEIQHSSLIYAKFDLLKDLSPEDKKEVEDYAYFTGESMNTPLRVIGIMMRNAIFEARGMKIKPYDYPPLEKTPPPEAQTAPKAP